MGNSKLVRQLNDQEVWAQLSNHQPATASSYRAFYSSVLCGITTNANFMLIPMDDHMVHRGDGIFEAIKVVDQRIYLLQAHLDRLFKSAEKIDLKIPFKINEIQEIIKETLRVSKLHQALIRVFVSRGPGGFSINPHECPASQLYIVVTEFKPPTVHQYQAGVTAGSSLIPAKLGWMAQVKSCNYLPNVMMKLESLKKGWDYSIGFDDQGYLCEGPTENLAIISAQGQFIYPEFNNCLRGTTLCRLVELIEQHQICTTRQQQILQTDLLSAQEVFMIGTTLDVLSVVEWNGKKIGPAAGAGVPGPKSQILRLLLQQDQLVAPKLN